MHTVPFFRGGDCLVEILGRMSKVAHYLFDIHEAARIHGVTPATPLSTPFVTELVGVHFGNLLPLMVGHASRRREAF